VFVVAAKKGNKYAEKHSRDDIIEIIDSLIEMLVSGEATNLYSALKSKRLYHQKISQWSNIHEDDQEVCDKIKELRGIAETAVMANTLDGEIPIAAGIFTAKAVYKYSDSSDKTPVLNIVKPYKVEYASKPEEK
jgi:hypothetical protein